MWWFKWFKWTKLLLFAILTYLNLAYISYIHALSDVSLGLFIDSGSFVSYLLLVALFSLIYWCSYRFISYSFYFSSFMSSSKIPFFVSVYLVSYGKHLCWFKLRLSKSVSKLCFLCKNTSSPKIRLSCSYKDSFCFFSSPFSSKPMPDWLSSDTSSITSLFWS